jgi:hypothetical protein
MTSRLNSVVAKNATTASDETSRNFIIHITVLQLNPDTS